MKAEENPKLRDQPQRQIDFRQLFPPPSDLSRPDDPTSRTEVPRPAIIEKKTANLLKYARIGGADWANLVFVLVTIIGGLVLSVRYFGGPETFRTATRWPREFLYSRPTNVEPINPKIDATPEQISSALKQMLIVREESSPAQEVTKQSGQSVALPPAGLNGRNPPSPLTSTSNLPVAASEGLARGQSTSAQVANQAGAGGQSTSSGEGPTSPTTPTTVDKGKNSTSAGKQRVQPGKESAVKGTCSKPSNRQIENAQKLARLESWRISQENAALRNMKNFNAPNPASLRGFNSNRATFGAPGIGPGGRR